VIGLQISITPTERYATVEGAPCRIWRGRTSLGVECLVFVCGVAVPDDDTDITEFDAALLPTGADGAMAPDIGFEPNGGWTPLVRAVASILPPGNPARGGRRDEEEDAEGSK